MKYNKIGSFLVKEELVVIDPCYKKKDIKNLGAKIKVKIGNWNCFTRTGKLKKPFFAIDSLKGYFRVAELVIFHEEHTPKNNEMSNKKWKKFSDHFCIDSGQAGFFNFTPYQKSLPKEKPLVDKPFSFMRESILSAQMKLSYLEAELRQRENNKEYVESLKIFNGNVKELEKFYDMEKKRCYLTIERFENHLKEKTYPSYLKEETTADFYNHICSLSSGEFGAGILENVGVVSQSGMGDCGMTLWLLRNKQEEIVGCRLVFILAKDMK